MRTGELLLETYRDRARAALLARNAGFTLGQVTTGRESVSQLSFFESHPGSPAAGADFDAIYVLLGLLADDLNVTAFRIAEARRQRLLYREGAYGWSLRNLERGFRPPLSGHFDNPYRHSAAAAGRSLLWGVFAPGAPQLAASLAREDAIVDHSGEGVWAAMFWAALLSAAFLESGWRELIEIGRAMIPADSKTSRAAEVAYQCRDMNLHELDARGRVLHHCGAEMYTDAPLNTGLALLGWLYGEKDLGLVLCKTANCGFAADRNAGLSGALFGIIHGTAALDRKWLDAIGPECPVGGGLRDAPPLEEAGSLANQLVVLGEKLLVFRNLGPALLTASTPEAVPATSAPAGDEDETAVDDTPTEPEPLSDPAAPSLAESLRANDLVAPLFERHLFGCLFEEGNLRLATFFGEQGPSIRSGGTVSVLCSASNTGQTVLRATFSAEGPEGWQLAAPQNQSPKIELDPGETKKFGYVLRAPISARVDGCQALRLGWTLAGGKRRAVRLPIVGMQRWRIVGPFRNAGTEGFAKSYGPEDNADPRADYLGRDGGLVAWREEVFPETEIPIEVELFNGREGVGYGVTGVFSPEAIEARLGIFTNDGVKVWLNGQRILQWHSHGPWRPSLDAVTAWVDIRVQAGENRFLVKFVRDEVPYRFGMILLGRDGMPHSSLSNSILPD